MNKVCLFKIITSGDLQSETNMKELLNCVKNGTGRFWPNVSSLSSVVYLSLPSVNHPALSLLTFHLY